MERTDFIEVFQYLPKQMTRIEFILSSHYFKELPPNKVVIIYKDQNLEHILGDFISLDQILGTKELCYIGMFKVGKRKRTFRITGFI